MNTQMDQYLLSAGSNDAQILFVADAPSKRAYDLGQVMTDSQMSLLRRLCYENGVAGKSIRIVIPCPYIPDDITHNERKVGEFLAAFRSQLVAIVKKMPNLKLIVTLGKTALRQVVGRSVKITEARGQLTPCALVDRVLLLPLLSPAHALRRPEVMPMLEGDFKQIGSLVESSWDTAIFESAADEAEYEWCLDLQKLLNDPPDCLTLDTETLGVEWAHGEPRILTVQLSYKKGHALIVPLSMDYFNDDALRGDSSKHLPKLTVATLAKLKDQLNQLLGDPECRVVGHNLKFDLHHLRNHGVSVANWYADTMQLAFAVDENMERKSLDECTRRWVPEMAGYADAFNSAEIHQGKSRMDLVPHDQMIRYAGGDTDACFRLMIALAKECRKDERQWNCFMNIQMAGLRAFVNMEANGIGVDVAALEDLGANYSVKEKVAYDELMQMAADKAPAVLRRHEGKGLSFSRDAFVADLLFSKDGFGLEPVVFTNGSKGGKKSDRIPSVSSKTHLPFFDHIPFVVKLIEYKKLQKMRGTYIGEKGGVEYQLVKPLKSGKLPLAIQKALSSANVFVAEHNQPTDEAIQPQGELARVGPILVDSNGYVFKVKEKPATGFWQYLHGGRVHPSFRLDNTVTGRTSSQNPNAQNFPKRGQAAKDFRRIFIPTEGFVFIEADLSQAELRIAAWMANDKKMLKIYQDGGDIHAATAAGVMNIPIEQVKKEDRQKAKAINFGFLYGMWWTKFMDYAKTDYGVTFTPKQAEAIRNRFFDLYPSLEAWHRNMKMFVRKHGYVRALHGALRRLPSINSSEDKVKQETERQAVNSPVQRFASDLGVLALARFDRDCPRDRMRAVAFIHDAVIIEARKDSVDEAASALKWYMQNNPLEELFDLIAPLPIASDVSIGETLASLEERPSTEEAKPDWCTD
jgi:uracil-DNA glycosylase family 4